MSDLQKKSFRLAATDLAKFQSDKLSKLKETIKTPLFKKIKVENKREIKNPSGNSVKTDEGELQTKVFDNHLILSMVMKNLTTCDLINLRLVNSLWKQIATFILRRRTNLKPIDIQFHEGKKKLLLNSLKYHDLSELQNILENSKSGDFPCYDFKIESPLDNPDLQKFLSSPVCGSQIKMLNLNFITLDSSETTKYSNGCYITHYKKSNRIEMIPYLRKLLTEQAVNLESLTLASLDFDLRREPTTEKLFPLPVTLPILTHLEIETYTVNSRTFRIAEVELGWTTELLNSAPNLKHFSTGTMKEEILTSLVEQEKSHLLTELNILNNSTCPMDELTLSQIKLKKVTVSSQLNDFYGRDKRRRDFCQFRERRALYPHVGSVALRILSMNVETLTSIALEFCDAFYALPTHIVFQNVKTFCLMGFDFNYMDKGQFVYKINLANLFPNLERVRLEGHVNADTCGVHTEDNFPFLVNEPMTKVNSLEVQHVCPVDWLKLLPQVFPNVVNLILENYWDFSRSGHLFWSFKLVQSMDLGTFFGVESLDSVFTGFSRETCKRLREHLTSGEDMNTVDDIEKLRVGPSIVQLRDMRQLHIKVMDTDPKVKSAASKLEGIRSRKRWQPRSSSSNVNLMSPVTSVFAFGVMPGLQQVDIIIDPNDSKFLPQAKSSGVHRLAKLAAALRPVAQHPRVTLLPIRMNN